LAAVNLSDRQPIFVGLKLDGQLKRRLASLIGPDRKYISADDPTFLMLCRLGDEEYVGKLVEERMTTDRIDDVRRNVLSILQRLCPDMRLPAQLEILAVEAPTDVSRRE
jgi:hypothetical protein